MSIRAITAQVLIWLHFWNIHHHFSAIRTITAHIKLCDRTEQHLFMKAKVEYGRRRSDASWFQLWCEHWTETWATCEREQQQTSLLRSCWFVSSLSWNVQHMRNVLVSLTRLLWDQICVASDVMWTWPSSADVSLRVLCRGRQYSTRRVT